ncbi:hypothetical protein [Nonomuraea salmonea]|uniref:Uncharacterized protein n=1 Tax=Nonomuraea salmonea TaxID=46181 RepID=A0ABV5P2P2_9ACTN
MTDSTTSDAIRQRILEWARLMECEPVVAEAAMAAHSLSPVSISHGYPESDDDVARLEKVAKLAYATGHVALRRGGNDYTTYVFGGPDSGQTAAEFAEQVVAMACSWWRVTLTPQPVRR